MRKTVLVFDLDDTLFKEIEFLKSAFREIAGTTECEGIYELMLQTYFQHGNAFETAISAFGLDMTVGGMLDIYRNHQPTVCLDYQTELTLVRLCQRNVMGIITDGRSITQRNKIAALGLERFFSRDNILISEEFGASKPAVELFLYFEKKFPHHHYCYIGDNPEKDFYGPNSLGWDTICLRDNGDMIRPQDFSVGREYLPKRCINAFNELESIY